jgi:CRP/FNR family cyclic AMP-dependent transcriptional regulator
VALEAVETLSLQRQVFDQLRTSHPQVERFLVELLAAQVRRLSSGLLEGRYLPADARVLRRLLDTAAIHDCGDHPIRIPLTQEDLATMAGTTRPTTNRALQQLEQAGHVILGRGRIDLVDVDAVVTQAG